MLALGWALLLCVGVDFSNPLLPGSVRLDPSESIEGVHYGVLATRSTASPMPESTSDRRDASRRVETALAGAPRPRPQALERRRALVVPTVRHHADDLTPASPSEDH
jgi:hypothetical protein